MFLARLAPRSISRPGRARSDVALARQAVVAAAASLLVAPASGPMALLFDDCLEDGRTRQRLVSMGLLSPRHQLPTGRLQPINDKKLQQEKRLVTEARQLQTQAVSCRSSITQEASKNVVILGQPPPATALSAVGKARSRAPPPLLPPRSSPPPVASPGQAETSASYSVQMLRLAPALRDRNDGTSTRQVVGVSQSHGGAAGAAATAAEAIEGAGGRAGAARARGRASRDEYQSAFQISHETAQVLEPHSVSIPYPPQDPPSWYMRHRHKTGAASVSEQRSRQMATATTEVPATKTSTKFHPPVSWESGRKPYPPCAHTNATVFSSAQRHAHAELDALPAPPSPSLQPPFDVEAARWFEPVVSGPLVGSSSLLPATRAGVGTSAPAIDAAWGLASGEGPPAAASGLPPLQEHLARAATALGASAAVTTAAARFEAEHADLRQVARRQLATLSLRPQSVRSSTLYASQIGEMWWHRLVIPDALPFPGSMLEARPPPRRRRPKRPLWRLDRSCWNIRREFFEEDWMLSALLDADWLVACGSHGLGWYHRAPTSPYAGSPYLRTTHSYLPSHVRDALHRYISKCHHDPSDWHLLDRSVAHAGVAHAHEVLRARARLVYGTFDYYAALHSETQTVTVRLSFFLPPRNLYLL